VRLARHAPVPANYYTEPLMYQGGSDDFLGPCQDAPFASEAWGIDFEAEVVCITGDVPMQCSPERALDGIRLVMLANDWSLRHLVPDELAKNFGFLQSKPATAFSPVAITLDEFTAPGATGATSAMSAAGSPEGSAWHHGRANITVQSQWNGRTVGLCDAGSDMTFHFGQLIAHVCKTRNVRAGSIIGSGTVSNKGVEVDGKKDWPKGYSCIAEKRAIETILDGEPKTDYMKFGDTIRIEAKGKDGTSLFGAIDQTVVKAG
jgi:fumarylacetoacetate (FAA) hydrolase